MTNFNRIRQTALTIAFTFMAFGGVAHAEDGYRRVSGFEQIKSECEFSPIRRFLQLAIKSDFSFSRCTMRAPLISA